MMAHLLKTERTVMCPATWRNMIERSQGQRVLGQSHSPTGKEYVREIEGAKKTREREKRYLRHDERLRKNQRKK